jgi:hypothetical protein
VAQDGQQPSACNGGAGGMRASSLRSILKRVRAAAAAAGEPAPRRKARAPVPAPRPRS